MTESGVGSKSNSRSVERAVIYGAVAMGFLIFVWPTPYEYMKYQSTLRRANRLTGVVEWATPRGWTNRTSSAPEVADHEEIDVVSEVTVVSDEIATEGLGKAAYVVLRNHSTHDLTAVHVSASILDAQGTVCTSGQVWGIAVDLHAGMPCEFGSLQTPTTRMNYGQKSE